MKNTFDFLKNLEKNNNREWFKAHKEEYEKSKKEVDSFGEELAIQMKNHDKLEGDKAKFFRIYRDVRFSKNKAPYKTNWGGSFQRKGKELRGGYYFHIQPNNESFIACGFWMPSKEDLLHIRKQISIDGDAFKIALSSPKLKKTFGQLKGDAVKTAPKGFSKEDEFIEYIRYKQFILIKKYDDKQVLNDSFSEQISEDFKTAKPFLDIMTLFLTTNFNGNSII